VYEYDMARGEFCYAKAVLRLAYVEARLLENTEIRISARGVRREEAKKIIMHLDLVLDNLIVGFCDWDDSHWGLVGRYLPTIVEDDLLAWSEAIGEAKDDLLEIIKGTVDGPADTLGKEDVTDDLEKRSGKLVATSTSTHTIPTFEPQPADPSVNQTLHIMVKEAMARGLDGTVAQQRMDLAKVIVALSHKEERDQTSTSSHHMWPNILGNEADRQLLCLPREEFPRSLPDQTPVIMPIPDKCPVIISSCTRLPGTPPQTSVDCPACVSSSPGLGTSCRPEWVCTRTSPSGSTTEVVGQGSLTTRTLPGYQGVRFVMEDSDSRTLEEEGIEVVSSEMNVAEEENEVDET
jgi:hypothetical protein